MTEDPKATPTPLTSAPAGNVLLYKGYAGRVEFDADPYQDGVGPGVLHGVLLGMRDVVTFEGDTPAEVRQAFRESVDDYLAWCAELGEPPEVPALDADLAPRAEAKRQG